MIADDVAGLLHRAAGEFDRERRAWLLEEALALALNRATPAERPGLIAEVRRVQRAEVRRP